ncbi:hypothetical protein FSHL1_006311 [Fusarium sambucinum]
MSTVNDCKFANKVGFAASHRLRVQHQTRDHRRNLHQQRVKTPPTAGWVQRKDALGNLERENKKPKIASSFLSLVQRNATRVSSTRHDKQGRDYEMAKQRRDMKKSAEHFTAMVDRVATTVMKLSLSVTEPLRRPNAENEVRQNKSDGTDSSDEPTE